MSRLRYNRTRAVGHLRRECGAMRRAIDRIGPFKLRVARERDLFNALSAAIVYQQLSGKAAQTIHGRFAALFEQAVPEAGQASRMSVQGLREAGLSNNKALAVLDLADKVVKGELKPMPRLRRLDDDQVVEHLCRVRGIGPWTAQMFLMFNLGRPDVMPATDLGVQKGVQAVYGLEDLPKPEEVNAITAHLEPYRSAASWYFWRAADTVLMA